MASLFENATEGILLTDKSGSIVLVNPAAERMFGYGAEELIEEKIEKLIPMRFLDRHVGLREGFYKHPSNRTMGIRSRSLCPPQRRKRISGGSESQSLHAKRMKILSLVLLSILPPVRKLKKTCCARKWSWKKSVMISAN